MGGDGKIINRILSLASSVMPAYAVDSSAYSTPTSSVHNTPKRSLLRRDGPGERWERSIERWDNSPKMSRSRDKKNAVKSTAPAATPTKNCHHRSDSGSSVGSDFAGEIGSGDAGKTSNDLAIPATDDSVVEKSGKTPSNASVEDDKKRGDLDAATKSQSEDSLSDIAEEEPNTLPSGGSRSFFPRNAPERLSSLLKKGVGGADEKLRGLWRRGTSNSGSFDKGLTPSSSKESIKGITNSGSKDSVKSASSSVGSQVSSPSGDQTKLTSSADSGIVISASRSPKKTCDQGSKLSMRLTSSSVDKQLFLEGEQPKLFQSESPDRYETPPTSPLKEDSAKQKSPVETVTVPAGLGRDKVILGDPLGALDSPTSSPSSSPPRPSSNFIASINSCNLMDLSEDDLTLRPAGLVNNAKSKYGSSLSHDLQLKVSTVKKTTLSPLTTELDPDNAQQSTGVMGEFNDPLLHPPTLSMGDSVSSHSSVSSSNSSDAAKITPVIPWSIAPIGSPFSVPVPIPVGATRASTLPRSVAEQGSPLKTLPPPAPKTPNRLSASSRPSRAIHRQLNQQIQKSPGPGRSNSASSSPPRPMEGDGRLVGRIPSGGRRSSSGSLASRNSNSLTSLSMSGISDVCGDGLPVHRRRGSDLVPRQAATLESNYSPSMWSNKWIRYSLLV